MTLGLNAELIPLSEPAAIPMLFSEYDCKITCDMPICYTGDNTSIMQIYDCTVVAYFMVFQKQIGKIGTPFLTVLSLCGHNDLPSGVFGIFMLFIKTIKLEKHCFPNLIICLLSTQEENSVLAGRIT